MTPRRITIARVRPSIPVEPTFAYLNASDKSVDVSLSGADLIATGSATGAGVRANLGLTVGGWYWETRFTSITGARAGLSRSGASTSAIIGNDGLSVGGPNSAGNVRVNGVETATGFGSIGTGDTIGHWLDTATGVYQVRKNNGSWFTVATLLVGHAWYPHLQVGSGGVQLIRTDPATFVYTAPTGVRAGLFHENSPIETDIYLSSDPYVEDSPALLPRIAGENQDLVIERHAKLWPWASTGTDRRGRLLALNGDRALDAWDGYEWFNAEYEILTGNEGDNFADFETWSAGVIESFGWDDERNVVIELADPLARLDSPIQPALYPEGGNNLAIVGKPVPITLGGVRLFPTLLSTLASGGTEFTYQVHDGPVFEIGNVWDRGDALGLGVDWDYTTGRTGFQLENQPDNPVSAEVIGGFETIAAVVPRSGVIGNFAVASWSGSPAAPQGWTNSSASSGTVTYTGTGGRFLALSSGGQLAQLDVTVPAAGYHYIRVTLASWVSGDLVVEADPGVGDIYPLGTTGAGTFEAVIYAAASVRLRNVSGSAIDLIVGSVALSEIEVIDTLPHWLREICVTRGGFALGDVDIAAADALHAKTGYELGWFGNTATSKLKLLRQAMDGFTGWVTTTRAGVVTVGRLEADGTEPVAFALNETNIRTIRERKDVGLNYSQRMAGARNYAAHTGGDLATSVTQAEQEQFLTEWGAVRSADGANVAPDPIPTGAAVTEASSANEAWSEAAGNPPQETLLTNGDDVRAEINRVAAIIGAENLRWWEVRALLEPGVADSIEMGQRVTITMPLDGLDGGVDATILGATIWVNQNEVVLNLLQYPEVS